MQELDKVIDSEKEVLGNIMSNNSLMLKTIGVLKESDLYRGTHQLIYKTMVQLYKNDYNFDSVIIMNRLKNEIKENLITITEITEISLQGIGSTFKSHLAAVIESSRQRKITELMENISNSNKKSQDKIDYIQNELMKMNMDEENDKVYNSAELIEMTMLKVEEAYNTKEGITGVKTGVKSIDNAINGLQRKNMIVFGARPSIGKTAFILKLLENMEANALFIQLDMGLDEIGCRMLASESNISNGKISRGKLEQNEWEKLSESFNQLSQKNNLMFYSPSEATVSKIRGKAKEIKTKKGLDVIVIDHIGKVTAENRGSSYDQMKEVSKGIKALARELDVAIVALCQLSRNVETRPDKHPIMSDLRDSGNIEEDADTIGMLYREGYYAAREKGESIRNDVFEVGFQKVRNGRLGVVKFDYNLETQKMLEKWDH